MARLSQNHKSELIRRNLMIRRRRSTAISLAATSMELAFAVPQVMLHALFKAH